MNWIIRLLKSLLYRTKVILLSHKQSSCLINAFYEQSVFFPDHSRLNAILMKNRTLAHFFWTIKSTKKINNKFCPWNSLVFTYVFDSFYIRCPDHMEKNEENGRSALDLLLLLLNCCCWYIVDAVVAFVVVKRMTKRILCCLKICLMKYNFL